MENAHLLSQRDIVTLLRQATNARAEGVVVMRCREGLRHGVWVQHGYVVGVHVAGRFDPLLELLRRDGALSAQAHRECLRALREREVRAGEVALEVAALAPNQLTAVLRAQLFARFSALLSIAAGEGHDAWLERGRVPAHELSTRVPLGSLLRRSTVVSPLAHTGGAARARQAEAPESALEVERANARRRLRTLARALHPDRHAQLDGALQKRFSDALARATAAYHGLERRTG